MHNIAIKLVVVHLCVMTVDDCIIETMSVTQALQTSQLYLQLEKCVG